MKDDDTKEIDRKSLDRHLARAECWICTGLDCGKRPFEGGVENWRWDGENWQHHHTYSVGHLICEYKPTENSEGEG